MAKSVVSTQWYTRVTIPHILGKPIIKQLAESIDVSGCVVAFHTGRKTKEQHIHIAFIMLKAIQKQSIDKRLQKLFGISGAGKYSNKAWDGKDEALSYFYHDDEEVIYYNLPELKAREPQILELSKKYKEIVAQAKGKASMKCVESIIDQAKRNNTTYSTSQIVRKIYEGVRQGTWYPPVGQQLERYVTEVLIKQGDDEDGDKAIDYLVDRFSQRWR